MNQMMYLHLLKSIRNELPPDQRSAFDIQFASRAKTPSTALILSLLLGGVGIDRFYLGNVGLGLGKMFTLGGFGIWSLVDFFRIMGAARSANIQVASEIKMMLADDGGSAQRLLTQGH